MTTSCQGKPECNKPATHHVICLDKNLCDECLHDYMQDASPEEQASITDLPTEHILIQRQGPFVKSTSLETYRCDRCGKIGGAAKVIDYAKVTCRLMLPKDWHASIDSISVPKYQFITIYCGECGECP